MSNNNYNAEQISVLEGLEAVRKRPGMYIGTTSREGLHSCLREVLDNSVDEFMAGHATTFALVIDKKGNALVCDDGRGIPTDIHPKTGKNTIETIMTVLHAGGKFDQNNYKFSGGLHGVGASVVNALSKRMDVWVLREEEVKHQAFQFGKPVSDLQTLSLEQFGKKYPVASENAVWKKTGTIISFLPDNTIFETTDFDFDQIDTQLRQMAYLNKGIKIKFIDQRGEGKNSSYHYPQGILTFLQDISQKDTLITPIIQHESKQDKFHLEFALAYCENYQEKMHAFTNGIINPEGGMHVTGFKTALTKVINNYAAAKNLAKKDEKFTSDDLKEGLRAILSIKMVDPQFTSQSKVKLGSTIARGLTDKIVSEKLETFLEENPKIAQTLIQKVQLALKARLAAKAAREAVQRKNPLESLSLPGKLADCSEKDPAKSEIFIVEGDSAGGSAKQGRDRHTQAILPLWGKVLNTEKATLDRIMNYEGIKNIIVAFGCGVADKFDLEKLRYHKIVLMADADVDGAHITTLLLTFLYRYMKPLLEANHVYMARPPLYKISWSKKQFEYVYSDIEKEAKITQILTANPDNKIEIQRYKGLGEMNPEQLWDTTMNPKTRLLWQITIGEAEMANKVFEDLMGSDVAPRKRFIEDNAIFVEDVDLV